MTRHSPIDFTIGGIRKAAVAIPDAFEFGDVNKISFSSGQYTAKTTKLPPTGLVPLLTLAYKLTVSLRW